MEIAMTGIAPTILQAIGNTPLVELRRVVPEGCARIVVKVEGQNPTGSMKDRMAQAMVAGAEHDGRLKPGGTIVEYTGGSTGASLALVTAAKGRSGLRPAEGSTLSCRRSAPWPPYRASPPC
jgi:cysteine synthase A